MRTAVLAISLWTPILASALGTPAAAGDDASALVRALAAQPGVTVTRGTDAGSSYTEWRKAGVFYRREKRGNDDALYGDDESGAGAVMCSWMIYDEVRNALASCPRAIASG